MLNNNVDYTEESVKSNTKYKVIKYFLKILGYFLLIFWILLIIGVAGTIFVFGIGLSSYVFMNLVATVFGESTGLIILSKVMPAFIIITPFYLVYAFYNRRHKTQSSVMRHIYTAFITLFIIVSVGIVGIFAWKEYNVWQINKNTVDKPFESSIQSFDNIVENKDNAKYLFVNDILSIKYPDKFVVGMSLIRGFKYPLDEYIVRIHAKEEGEYRYGTKKIMFVSIFVDSVDNYQFINKDVRSYSRSVKNTLNGMPVQIGGFRDEWSEESWRVIDIIFAQDASRVAVVSFRVIEEYIEKYPELQKLFMEMVKSFQVEKQPINISEIQEYIDYNSLTSYRERDWNTFVCDVMNEYSNWESDIDKAYAFFIKGKPDTWKHFKLAKEKLIAHKTFLDNAPYGIAGNVDVVKFVINEKIEIIDKILKEKRINKSTLTDLMQPLDSLERVGNIIKQERKSCK